MAVDADLNAGLLCEEEAKQRRAEVTQLEVSYRLTRWWTAVRRWSC
ncbi:MAG: hypothetical protein GPOALKHO_001742 [Sodalis sp.]|nr:MAG: hypothetical protein GPOALKHO_001742 [Sodalis sp.]